MSDEQKAREAEVFGQDLSLEDLDAVAGGEVTDVDVCSGSADDPERRKALQKDADTNNCIRYDYRQIYGGGGFPNCAATVEDGSWCERNDACYSTAVDYQGLKSCKKAWR